MMNVTTNYLYSSVKRLWTSAHNAVEFSFNVLIVLSFKIDKNLFFIIVLVIKKKNVKLVPSTSHQSTWIKQSKIS